MSKSGENSQPESDAVSKPETTATQTITTSVESGLNKKDITVVEVEKPYFVYFPDIINVPAKVYANNAFPNGKILMVYYKGTTHKASKPEELGEIQIVESTDNGETWSKPRTVLTPDLLKKVGIGTDEVPLEARDPNLAMLNDGTLLLTFFTRKPGGNANIVYICESTNGGETWDKPVQIPCEMLNDVGYCKRGNIAVFENDEILIPMYDGPSTQMAVVVSGKRTKPNTWTWGEPRILKQSSDIGATINEVSLLSTGGNTVYAFVREAGHMFKSDDRGVNWTQIGTQNKLHQPGLIPLKDGGIFCTYTRPNAPRPVYGKLFYPDKGWDAAKEQLIYKYPEKGQPIDMGDPSAVLTNDNRLLTVYYVTPIRKILGTFTDPKDWNALNK